MKTKKTIFGVLIGIAVVAAIIVIFSDSKIVNSNRNVAGLTMASVFQIKKPVLSNQTSGDVAELNSIIKSQVGIIGKLITSDTALKVNLEARKKAMISLAHTNPDGFLAAVLPIDIKNKIPIEFQSQLETSVTKEGILEIVHIDNFDKKQDKSQYLYVLRQNGKETLIHPTSSLKVAPGSFAKVSGINIDNILVAETRNISITPPRPTPTELLEVSSTSVPATVGEQKILVVLIRYLNSGHIPFTKEQADQMVFNGQSQKLLRQQSNGKSYLGGKVIDWVTLQKDTPPTSLFGLCYDVTVASSEIQEVLVRENILLNDFSQVIYLMDGPGTKGGCSTTLVDVSVNNVIYKLAQGWVGLENYNEQAFPGQPFPWTKFENIFSHEFGHGLGIRTHSFGLDCGTVVYAKNCSTIEYGNLYDVMGVGWYSLHFNAFLKEKLGWVGTDSILTITKSGRYTLNQYEMSSPLGQQRKQFAKIKATNTDLFPYYIEYRQPIGFDARLSYPDIISNTKGLLINKSERDNYFGSISLLLDMQPTSADWYSDADQASLNGDNIFIDEETGITIGPIINRTPTTITFDVKIKPTE